MATGDIPTRADLADAVAYLQAGLDGRWTVREWGEWSARAFSWCYRTTRGCLLLIERVRALEAELALLRTERDRLLRATAPVAPTIVPAMRRATPPPPPPASGAEAAALKGPARRQPDDREREAKRKLMLGLGALVDAVPAEVAEDVWRDISQVDLSIEDPEWGPEGETVYEPGPD